jgi:glycosyltransferase involved in cell wall biosynthesis
MKREGRSLKILLASTSIRLSRAEQAFSFIYEEIIRLLHRGIEVHIARLRYGGSYCYHKICVHDVKKRDLLMIDPYILLLNVTLSVKDASSLRNAYKELLCVQHVSKLINIVKPHIIHAHFAYPEGWCALLAKLISNNKVPLVVTVHGYDINVLPEYGYGIRLNYFFDVKVRTVLRHADYVIAVSKELASKVEELGAKNYVYIPNGVDSKIFNPLIGIIEKEKVENIRHKWGVEDADLVIGFFRHLYPWYGVHYIPLIARLVTKNTSAKVKFVLAGSADPKYTELLHKLIVKLDLKADIIYLGKIPRTLMPLIYQAVDIVINTSLTDGMPPSTLEAMASGKPVVSFASGGNKELIVDGYNGFLIRLKNYRDFASKLLYLIENPSEAKKMGLNGRKLAEERYSLEKRIDKIINLYKSLI